MHIPCAATFPPDEVVAFFNMLHSRVEVTKSSVWHLSVVHLADHLQVDSMLDTVAPWVWNRSHIEHLNDWLAVTRLHRSEEHTSELQSLMRISYAVFCLKKKKTKTNRNVTKTLPL